MPVMGILLLLHNFPPSYPQTMWITRFLLISITSLRCIHSSGGQVFHTFYKQHPSKKLSPLVVDNFSTLSTYSLLFDRLSTNNVDKFSTFSTILPKWASCPQQVWKTCPQYPQSRNLRVTCPQILWTSFPHFPQRHLASLHIPLLQKMWSRDLILYDVRKKRIKWINRQKMWITPLCLCKSTCLI